MRQTKADTTQAADTLAAAAETVKKGEGVELNADGTINLEAEAAKEKQDLAEVLDQLNLAAVNNRVFSFSKESQDLMEKFKQVLKDLVNGAPHAYNDLERLLKDSEKQLDKMYGSLPPFLQNLIKQLPTKVTAALAPELMAAAAEKPDDHLNAASASAKQQKKSQKYAKQGYKYAKKYPPLKKLVSEQGAIAAMLRAILNFLKLRFPAVVTGTNVLMSLAVFSKSSQTTAYHLHFPLHPITSLGTDANDFGCSSPLRLLVLPQARPRGPPRARGRQRPVLAVRPQ